MPRAVLGGVESTRRGGTGRAEGREAPYWAGACKCSPRRHGREPRGGSSRRGAGSSHWQQPRSAACNCSPRRHFLRRVGGSSQKSGRCVLSSPSLSLPSTARALVLSSPSLRPRAPQHWRAVLGSIGAPSLRLGRRHCGFRHCASGAVIAGSVIAPRAPSLRVPSLRLGLRVRVRILFAPVCQSTAPPPTCRSHARAGRGG